LHKKERIAGGGDCYTWRKIERQRKKAAAEKRDSGAFLKERPLGAEERALCPVKNHEKVRKRRSDTGKKEGTMFHGRRVERRPATATPIKKKGVPEISGGQAVRVREKRTMFSFR